MSFEDLLRLDAANVFAGGADFGETITYRRKDGREYSFTAQVFRLQPDAVLGAKDLDAPHYEVFIPRDPANVNGLAEAPDRGADVVVLTHPLSRGCQTEHRVANVSGGDPGGWTLKFR